MKRLFPSVFRRDERDEHGSSRRYRDRTFGQAVF